MTPGSPRRASTQSGWRGNTAASWASRTIVRPWCRCPWPTTMPACPSPIGSICPRPGPTMRSGGQKPKCRRTSSSRPNRGSRWTSCAAKAAGIPLGTVLADAGYGYDSQFRDGVTQMGLRYAVGIQSNVLMWQADAILPVPAPDGQKPSRPQLREQQISAKELALGQSDEAWHMITWREHGEAFTSRFARWRVRPVTRAEQPAEEWLMIEWPADEAEPTKYWLSTLPADISFEELVDRTKLRWRIERDYQ